MSLSTAMWRFGASEFLCVVLTHALPQAFSAENAPPQVTDDGLELSKKTKHRLVYLRPGAAFGQYERVAIADCYVEFSKSWLHEYNASVREPGRRISDEHLERAKTDLAREFRRIFSDELAKSGYETTDAAAPDVLVLRPALVNIAVSAPDLMRPGRSVVYAQSAGQMTLYLELWDGGTNTILARVVDAQADPGMYGQRTSSVTNRAAADRILRQWASELRKKLDLARGKPDQP